MAAPCWANTRGAAAIAVTAAPVASMLRRLGSRLGSMSGTLPDPFSRGAPRVRRGWADVGAICSTGPRGAEGYGTSVRAKRYDAASALAERLPYALGGGDDAGSDHELAAHEDQ